MVAWVQDTNTKLGESLYILEACISELKTALSINTKQFKSVATQKDFDIYPTCNLSENSN